MALNDTPTPAPGLCHAHTLLEQNVVAMRKTFDTFAAEAARDHSRMRDTLLELTQQFHRELLEVAALAAQAKGAALMPDPEHPHRRETDPPDDEHAHHRDVAVSVTLTRAEVSKYLRWVAVGIGVLVFAVVGFALVAGRDGLDIWNKTAGQVVK